MKKFRIILLSLLLAPATLLAVQAAEDILPTISGYVTLQTKAKGSVGGDLASIYTGRESELPNAKPGKKILVEGTNPGTGASVTVTEVDAPAGQPAYSFVIPVKSLINQTATARATMKNPSISLTFNSASNTTPASDSDSVASIASVASSETMSVKKFVAARNGSKATVQGLMFSKGTAAKGRFKLTFTK